MVEFLLMRDIDAKMRELVGLYQMEKERADQLERRVKELEKKTPHTLGRILKNASPSALIASPQ